MKLHAKIVLQVHDEIVVECDEDDRENAEFVIQLCMENTYKISVPLIAKPVVGKTYGELK